MDYNNDRDRYERDKYFRGYENGDDVSTEMVSYTQVDPQSEPPQKHSKGKKKKLTKKERKELRKHQASYEKQLVAEGKIAPRYRYVPRNNFARILSVCLAFVFGFFAAFGVLIGGFAWAGTKTKVEDVIKIAVPDIDVYEYIDKEAAQLSVLDLVVKMSQEDYKNLNVIGKYTPFLKTTLDGLNEQLKEKIGISLNVDELMEVNFSEFAEYFSNNVLQTIALADVLGIKDPDNLEEGEAQPDKIMVALCYRTNEDGEKVKTTIGDLTTGAEGILMDIKLADVLGINGPDDTEADAIMKALCYKDEDGEKVPTSIGDLTSGATDILMDIALADVIGETDDPIMDSLCYKADGSKVTINDLTEDAQGILMDVELSKALSIDENDPDADPIMKALCFKTQEDGTSTNTTIKDLTENATDLIQDIEIETLLSTGANSDAAIRYLAYGTQAEYNEETQQYENGNYYIENGEIRMCLDPETNEPYAKKKVKSLTDEDADIIGGAKIRDLVNITEDSSQLLKTLGDYSITELTEEKIQSFTIGELIEVSEDSGILSALKDKTLDELQDPETIDGLNVGEVLNIDEKDPDTSGLMLKIAGWTIGELKEQDKIETLCIGDVLKIEDDADGFMSAVKDWSLKELSQQHRIERLKISEIINIDTDSSLIMQAMKDWRICDLTKQEKIDSLTLGSVIAINDDSAQILKSLKDTRIGEFSDAIDTLALSDILSEEDLDGNKILRNLKYSTLKSLSADISNISVAEVFGDEIYSYLSLDEMKAAYRARLAAHIEAGGTEDEVGAIENGTYKELVEAYEINKNFEDMSTLVPNKVTLAEGETVEIVYSDGTHTLTYGWMYENVPVKEDQLVITKDGAYMNFTHRVVPVYTWYTVNYDNGELVELPGDSVTESGDEFTFHAADGKEYGITEKRGDYSYSYEDENGNLVKVDLERKISAYKLGGQTYPVNNMGDMLYLENTCRVHTSVEDDKLIYSIDEPDTKVIKAYYYKDGTTYKIVEDENVVTSYYGKVGGERVQLDRYLDGVWYLLFRDDAEGANKPVLEISGSISGAADHINAMPLYEMYLHGFIQSNPYQKLPVAFPHEGETYKNLNELTVSGIIAYVKHLISSTPAVSNP